MALKVFTVDELTTASSSSREKITPEILPSGVTSVCIDVPMPLELQIVCVDALFSAAEEDEDEDEDEGVVDAIFMADPDHMS